MKHLWILNLFVAADSMVVGGAGDSLTALQNPFLQPPVAGRVAQGQLQMEVPSRQKPPKLQVYSPLPLLVFVSVSHS